MLNFKLKCCSVLLIASAALFSCEKEQNLVKENQKNPVFSGGGGGSPCALVNEIADDEINEVRNNFGKALAGAMNESEVRNFVKDKSVNSKEYTGTGEFIFELSKNETVDGDRTFAEVLGENSTSHSIEYFENRIVKKDPSLSVYVFPGTNNDSVDQWNTADHIPQVAIRPRNHNEGDAVVGYDNEQNEVTISSEVPEDLTLVVKNNEVLVPVDKGSHEAWNSTHNIPDIYDTLIARGAVATESPCVQYMKQNEVARAKRNDDCDDDGIKNCNDCDDPCDDCDPGCDSEENDCDRDGIKNKNDCHDDCDNNDPNCNCDRDTRGSPETIYKIKYTNESSLRNAADWLDGDHEIKVIYVTGDKDRTDETISGSKIQSFKRHKLFDEIKGKNSGTDWVNYSAEFFIWQKPKNGDKWKYEWIEIENNSTDITIDLGVESKVAPGTTLSANISFNISDQDEKLGTATAEYCENAIWNQAPIQKTGSLEFTVHEPW